MLFPNFVATHVQVHIATEHPTGFTSSSCVDINGEGEMLTGGNWWMLRSWKEGEPSMRPVGNTVRLEAFSTSAYSELAESTRYIPMYRPGWNWCVGSSNMYRRVLLDRLRPRLATDTIYGGVDGFFTPILHAITGTNLIDRLLNAYRVHGANDFSMLPGLVGVSSSYGEAEARSYATAKLTLLSLIDGIEHVLKTAPANRYWQILDTASSVSRGQRMFAESEIKAALARQYVQLAALSGERSLIRELMQRMKRSDCMEIVLASRKGLPLLSAVRRITVAEWRRRLRRLARRQ